MVKGRPSLGVFTAEGGQFLGGHGMSDDAKTRTLTGLSKIYDTGSAQRVRAKEIVVVDGRRVSISLAAQAKIASALLGDELAQDQGFLGRFLVCYPDSRIGTREVRLAPSDADPRVEAFTDRVERLLYLQDGIKAPLRLPVLVLDDEAWEVFRAFSQAIEDNVGEGKHWFPVRATAQRMAENVGRIAGVLHLFAHGGTDKPIDGDTTRVRLRDRRLLLEGSAAAHRWRHRRRRDAGGQRPRQMDREPARRHDRAVDHPAVRA